VSQSEEWEERGEHDVRGLRACMAVTLEVKLVSALACPAAPFFLPSAPRRRTHLRVAHYPVEGRMEVCVRAFYRRAGWD